MNELHRVLRKGGNVIMLEPCISVLGLIVYGAFHDEPIAITKQIEWLAPDTWKPENIDLYAMQGNATRIFMTKNIAQT